MALTNGKMKKDADTYNTDVMKRIAKVINNGRMEHKTKEERLKNIIDAVYVDGWNHGYAMVKKEERESLLAGGNMYV